MFNRSGFNQLPFNRPFSANVYGVFMLDGTGDMTVTANLIVHPSFDLSGTGELVFNSIREQFAAFVLEGVGELDFEAIREQYGSFVFQGIGELTFSAERYHVDQIEFTGSFEPGDRIVIDSKLLTITKNGVNALEDMDGDFFALNLGSNGIVYTDGETGRSVLLRITHRDKFV